MSATASTVPASRLHTASEPAEVHTAYIIGPPRSGTTMLGYVLAGDKATLSLSEPYLAHSVTCDWQLQRMFYRLQKAGHLRRRKPPYHGDAQAFGRFLVQMARDNDYQRLVIKETYRRTGLPADWCNEPLLDELLSGGAATLALIRHPYDVAASTIRLCRWVIGWPGRLLRLRARNLPTFPTADAVVRWAAENWRSYVDWAARRGLELLRYEDFVARPRQRLGEVCRRLGVPADERMLDFSQPRTAFGGLGDPEVLKAPRPIDRTAVGRGRTLSADQRRIVDELCAAPARRLGYES